MSDSPRLWIEELRILRRFEDSPEDLVRRITFRRGLNIVWAAPSGDDDKQVDQPGYGGHAAGKTSLCRLLRFLLGEAHFGSRFMRDRILNAFPDGWIAGKVWLNGVSWIVARAFAAGPRPKILKADSIDALHDSDGEVLRIDNYRAALHDALVAPLAVGTFPSTGKKIEFPHVLEWQSRDQECRFGGLLEWRHPSSDSGSPDLFAEEQRFLIRAVLGMVDEPISREIEERSRLEHALEALPGELAFHRRVLTETLEDLRKRLSGPDVLLVGTSLFVDAVKRLVEQARDREVNAIDQKIEALPMADLEEELSKSQQILGVRQHQAEEIEAAIEEAETELKTLETAGTEGKLDRFWEKLRPTDRYCRVPIEVARFRCPLRQEFEPPDTGQTQKLDFDRELALANSLLKARRADAEKARANVTDAEKVVGELKVQVDGRRAQLNALSDRRYEARERHRSTVDAAQRAERSQRQIEELEARTAILAREIEDSKQRLDALQKAQVRRVGDFSSSFEEVLQSILGQQIEAKCQFSRELIQLIVARDGELDSAAITTLKTIAFDLAALQMTVAGTAMHPGLVIHDSPREADMATPLYRRVFHAAHAMERAGAEPGFQLIITTTEPPPTELRKGPWLRLKLNSAIPEERLFGRNL